MAIAQSKLMAASLTPLTGEGAIDNKQFSKHLSWLLDNGCDGAVLFGTTGEGNSFSVAERQSALELIIDDAIPADRLMVATGCCAISDTLSLTSHALDQGVNAVLVLPPFYYKSVSDQGLYEYFARFVDRIGESRLELYLYHFPKMAIVSFSPELIARLQDAYPDIVCGIKDSTGDYDHTMSLQKNFPDLKVFAGTEHFLLDYLRAGGAGCISATMNITAPYAASICANLQDQHIEQLQQQLSAIRELLQQYPLTGALKGLLAELTGLDNWRNTRLPLRCMDHQSVSELVSSLTDLDFHLEYGNAT